MSDKQMIEPIYVRPNDIAAMYSISVSEVYRALYDGELKARKMGRAWLIHRADVDTWFLAHSAPYTPKPGESEQE